MREKMTLRELMASQLFDSSTEFALVTTNDDIPFDPDDYFVAGAFADYVVYKVEAYEKGKIKIYFDIEPKVRRATV